MIKVLKLEDDININKHWTIGTNKLAINKIRFHKKIKLNWDIQSKLWEFNLPDSDPFVDIFNNKDYDIAMLLEDVLRIYTNQSVTDDSIQLSDIYLQYLRKEESTGKWSNKQIVNNTDNSQEVMIVNTLPNIIIENSVLNELINAINTYDIKFFK